MADVGEPTTAATYATHRAIEAKAELERAAGLTRNQREQALLRARAAALPVDPVA